MCQCQRRYHDTIGSAALKRWNDHAAKQKLIFVRTRNFVTQEVVKIDVTIKYRGLGCVTQPSLFLLCALSFATFRRLIPENVESVCKVGWDKINCRKEALRVAGIFVRNATQTTCASAVAVRRIEITKQYNQKTHLLTDIDSLQTQVCQSPLWCYQRISSTFLDVHWKHVQSPLRSQVYVRPVMAAQY